MPRRLSRIFLASSRYSWPKTLWLGIYSDLHGRPTSIRHRMLTPSSNASTRLSRQTISLHQCRTPTASYPASSIMVSTYRTLEQEVQVVVTTSVMWPVEVSSAIWTDSLMLINVARSNMIWFSSKHTSLVICGLQRIRRSSAATTMIATYQGIVQSLNLPRFRLPQR